MEALAITIFCSVLLVLFFVILFLGSQRQRRLSCEQEALLPLEDDFDAAAPGSSAPCSEPQPAHANPSASPTRL